LEDAGPVKLTFAHDDGLTSLDEVYPWEVSVTDLMGVLPFFCGTKAAKVSGLRVAVRRKMGDTVLGCTLRFQSKELGSRTCLLDFSKKQTTSKDLVQIVKCVKGDHAMTLRGWTHSRDVTRTLRHSDGLTSEDVRGSKAYESADGTATRSFTKSLSACRKDTSSSAIASSSLQVDSTGGTASSISSESSVVRAIDPAKLEIMTINCGSLGLHLDTLLNYECNVIVVTESGVHGQTDNLLSVISSISSRLHNKGWDAFFSLRQGVSQGWCRHSR
jgi:hypothetical protein